MLSRKMFFRKLSHSLLAIMVVVTTLYAEKSVAVLNIKSSAVEKGDCIAVTNFMTTEMRKVPGFRIISWDAVTNMLEHDAGKQALGCDDENCIAEIGAALGVDYIVAGDIGTLGKRFVCNLKLIDINRTSTRNSVSEVIKGDIGMLFDLLPGMVSRLLSISDMQGGLRVKNTTTSGSVVGTEGVRGEVVRDVQVTCTRKFIVKMNSSPQGAVAFLDGKLLCQSTPCSKAIPQGVHAIRIVKEMYRDYEAELTVNRNGQEIVAPLVPTFGFLDIRTQPSGVSVAINGKSRGKTPLNRVKLAEGAYEVLLGNNCYYKKIVTVNVQSGKTKSISQSLHPKEGILELRAVHKKSGNDIIASVIINGKKIGETPYLGKAPVCAQSVVVKTEKFGKKSVEIRLAEGQRFSKTVKFGGFGGSNSDGTVSDADGNVYHTVKIGKQVWTVENLRTTKYNDGTPIPKVKRRSRRKSLNSGAYCYYDNSTSNKKKYGALYNWYAVNTGKLAPAGWHVPTDEDWQELEVFLIANGYNWDGTKSKNKTAKSLASKTEWRSTNYRGDIGNDMSSNNRTGFSALPGGYRNDYGSFSYQSLSAYWWSATEGSASYAYYRSLYYDNETLGRDDYVKQYGFSVRLVRDN